MRPKISRSAPMSSQVIRKSPFRGRMHKGLVDDSTSNEQCHQKKACGSCVYINEPYVPRLKEKHAAGIAHLKELGQLGSSRIIDPLPSPTPLHYRTVFKLAVRPAIIPPRGSSFGYSPRYGNRNEKPRRFSIGLFERGSHRVSVDMTQCPIHTKELTQLLIELQHELENSTLDPWDESKGTGDVRYVVARSSHQTGEIMLVWVVSKPQKAELIRITQKLRRQEYKINSTYMNVHSGSGNAIFGDEMIHLTGSEGLRETICDLRLELRPRSFFQVNPWQATQLYRRVEIHASAGSRGVAWDLYTGTGQIGLLLARMGYKTLGVEEVEDAVKDANANAIRNELQEKFIGMTARVEDAVFSFPEWAKDPSLIVVNPSRRGIHESARMQILAALRRNPTAKLIYVSCDIKTLTRDLADLQQATQKLKQIEAFDMFAQTDQMEWLAVLA